MNTKEMRIRKQLESTRGGTVDLHASERLQDESVIALQLHCEVKTLQAWRSRGGGPPFVKIGRLVRYKPQDVDAWIQARTMANTRKVQHD